MEDFFGTEPDIPTGIHRTKHKSSSGKQRSPSHGRRASSSGPGPPLLTHVPRQHTSGAASSSGIPLRSLAGVTSPPLIHATSSYTARPHRPPLGGGDEGEVSVLDDVSLVDILGTNSVLDPNDFSKSVVNITAEISPLSESSSFDRSLYWIHHERTTLPAKFEDFQYVLSRTPGLYEHEAAVASKCLGEVKMQRKVFANGRYFGPVYHQATTAHQSAVQNIVAKATFLSIPIFTRMSPDTDDSPTGGNLIQRPLERLFNHLVEYLKDEHDRHHHRYLTSKVLRSQTTHPVRSLMQYSNILALDHRRDQCQAMLQLQEFGDNHQPFVHVPELWVLIINECTIITSGPFRIDDLCGSNMRLSRPVHAHDRRMILRYFNLQGVLHSFRCRTWLGLLDVIDRLESDIDDLRACLDRPSLTSSYALVDSKFRAMNCSRWNRRTSDDNAARFVSVRLVGVSPDARLNVRYSERKLREDLRTTWALFALIAKLKQAEKDVKSRRTSLAHQGRENILKTRIVDLNKKLLKAKRDRMSNRFRLFAVRYKLIDPEGQMWGEDRKYIESRADLSTEELEKYRALLDLKISDIMGNQGDECTSGNDTEVAEVPTIVDTVVSALETLDPPNPLLRKVTFVEGPSVRYQTSDNVADPDLDLAKKLARFEQDVARTARDGLAEARDQFLPPKRRFTSLSLMSPGGGGPQRPHRAKTEFDLEAQRATHDMKSSTNFNIRAILPTTHQSNTDRDAHAPFSETRRTRRGSSPRSGARRPGIYKQGFSPTSPPVITKVILPASPQRVPILSKFRELSSSQPQEEIATQNSRHRQNDLPLPDPSGLSRPSTADDQTTNIESMASDRLELKRRQDKFRDLLPFFKWQRPAEYAPITPRESKMQQDFGKSSPIDHTRSNSLPRLEHVLRKAEDKDVCATLTEINDMLGNETRPRNEELLVEARQYNDVEAVSHTEVLASLNQEYHQLVLQSPDAKAESQASESMTLWTAKMRLVLVIDTLLRRFVGLDHFGEHVILKVWGLVSRLTSTTLDEVGHCLITKCPILTFSTRSTKLVKDKENPVQ